ncbi:helix-turn-helix domain-containing protein [Modestobacter sp. SYSU DS0511]
MSGAGKRAAFDAQRVAPAVRIRLWEQATARFLVPMRISAAGSSILGVISAREVDQVSICRMSATPHAAVRDGGLADGAGADHYKVAVGLHGRSVVSQHGRRVALGPGDMTVYDTSEPYSVSGDVRFGLLVARIPRDALGLSRDRVAAVAATALPGAAAGAVGRGLIHAATSKRADGGLEPLLDALERLVRSAPPVRLPAHRDRAALLTAAKELIGRRIADPDLAPGHVAAVLGVSRRYLYELFAAETGPVAEYVRTVRLERARELLVAATADEVPVAEVALACGFADPAHFSRVFRQAYGLSPRQYRLSQGSGRAGR